MRSLSRELDSAFKMDCGCISARNARYYCGKHTPKTINCPLVLEAQRIKNGGLTDQEIEDGFFIDIVLGKCSIRKSNKERN